MHTQALQNAATHLETLYAHDAPPSDFGDWVGRAGMLSGIAGLVTLDVLGAPAGELSVASAWGCIAAAVAIAFSGVCTVAWMTAGTNRH